LNPRNERKKKGGRLLSYPVEEKGGDQRAKRAVETKVPREGQSKRSFSTEISICSRAAGQQTIRGVSGDPKKKGKKVPFPRGIPEKGNRGI